VHMRVVPMWMLVVHIHFIKSQNVRGSAVMWCGWLHVSRFPLFLAPQTDNGQLIRGKLETFETFGTGFPFSVGKQARSFGCSWIRGAKFGVEGC